MIGSRPRAGLRGPTRGRGLDGRRACADAFFVGSGGRRAFLFAFLLWALLLGGNEAVCQGRIASRLRMTDREGRPLGELLLPDGRFDLVFVHSFHLTPVAERFEVLDSAEGLVLHLFELEYQSPGVGMPADAEGGYRLVDGKFVLAMDRRFSLIPLLVSIVPGHGILAGGVFHPFTDWAPQESAIYIAAEAVH